MDNLKPPIPKQLVNEKAIKIYAAFLAALTIIIIADRWLNRCNWKTHSAASHTTLRAAYVKLTQALNRRTSWSLFGQPSVGLTLIVAIYVLANAILCVTPIAIYQLNHFASRLGWLTAINMVLCILFGLKNTPLGQVARVSHLELNILHRVVGYTTVALVLLHAALYTWYRGRIGYWSRLIIPANLAGIGACIAMLVLCMGIWRHRNYELFYVSHVGGCVSALVLAYLHRPNWLKKIPLVMAFGGSIWLLDRIIRAARMSRNGINNNATLYPLPGNAIRILLRKPHRKNALPGSHCFLWIPCIHVSQNHPFTIVSNGPSGLELVVRPREGFTKETLRLACQRPGERFLASVDGPYGSVPEMKDYDRVVLMAGGSGAAYTVGLLNRVLSQNSGASLDNVYFIWTVRDTVHLSWFYQHLCRFGKTRVKLIIYITNEAAASSPDEVVRTALEASRVSNSMETALLSKKDSMSYETISELLDMEMCLDGVTTDNGEGIDGVARFHYMKMRPENDIGQILDEARHTDRVLVAACGPKSLMDAVRDSVDTWRGRRSIDLHCESFGSS